MIWAWGAAGSLDTWSRYERRDLEPWPMQTLTHDDDDDDVDDVDDHDESDYERQDLELWPMQTLSRNTLQGSTLRI